MDALAGFKAPALPWPGQRECMPGLQMHFDALMLLRIPGHMAPLARVALRAQQTVQMEQQIEIERGGDPQRQ